LLLVLSPQPIYNLKWALNKKQAYVQKVFIDEVVGVVFLLFNIENKNNKPEQPKGTYSRRTTEPF
jgi:hypothetical protein